MREIIDVVNNSKKDVSKEELKRYFNLEEIEVDEVNKLTVLYWFNVSGFYIPLKPSICSYALSTVDGWIELAKNDKKLEYHNCDGEKARPGDIAIKDFHIILDSESVDEFIRIPNRYIYTNIHLDYKKKNVINRNLTGEDIYMLDDNKNITEISICDSHEDGA